MCLRIERMSQENVRISDLLGYIGILILENSNKLVWLFLKPK